jgi:dTDP-4-amino-4,6-dideoxygalactose transaminase
VEYFERSIAAIAGTRHAIGVSSGTDAILLALMALDIKAGDEVLCPSFTFFATAGCIARCGARPVFVDSCPVCFNIDVADARKRVSPRTKAIIPVHLFGQMAEMNSVMELAHEYNLSVIEDAAQSLGAAYHGRPSGSIGDFGTFSFYPSKNLGGFGDSGMLVTNNDALAEKARLLRNHGAQSRYFHQMVGGNFRIDALQSALIGVKVVHLEEYSSRRMDNAAYYRSRLASVPGIAQISPSSCCAAAPGAPLSEANAEPNSAVRILLPSQRGHTKHIWNQYTLRVLGAKRDAFREFLQSRHIGSEIYYPRPMHMQECFHIPGYSQPSLPVCERLTRECLSIPIFSDLTRAQQDCVIGAIIAFTAETFPPD